MIHVAQNKTVKIRKSSGRKNTAGDEKIAKLALSGRLGIAAKRAVRDQKAKGIAVTYKRGDEIIKETADGVRHVIGIVRKRSFTIPKGVRVIGK